MVGQPEGEKLFRVPRHRREYDIKINLNEIGWKSLGCIHLAWDKNKWRAVMGMVIQLGVLCSVGIS